MEYTTVRMIILEGFNAKTSHGRIMKIDKLGARPARQSLQSHISNVAVAPNIDCVYWAESNHILYFIIRHS